MDGFTWKDGDRTIRFGRGCAASAGELTGSGYVLITTPRGEASAPGVAGDAGAVLHAPPGRVDEIAAEMTWVHRPVKDLTPFPGFCRPRVVINDPALSASQPPAELAASAANSLAHAVEGAVTTLTSPVPRLTAREAARLTDAAYAGVGEPGPASEPDRDALALAALLSGYAIDAAWYGLHHVMSQTLVREAGLGHGPANAAMLPHTMRALRRRGLELVVPPELAERLAALAGATRLGVDEAALDQCAEVAAQRPELAHTPPPAGREELRAIYESAR